MNRSLLISGTGTSIGKTMVSLAICLWGQKKGLKTGYFKPVQCGLEITDAHLISLACPKVETHSGYTFAMPASPHLAAEAENQVMVPSHLQEIYLQLKSEYDLLIVETAGGVAVPWNRQGYSAMDFSVTLKLPVLVVAAPSLGTLSHTLTAQAYVQEKKAQVSGFIFSRTEAINSPLEKDNAETLETLTQWPFWGSLPFLNHDFSEPLSENNQALLLAPLSSSLATWWDKNPA